MSAMDSERRVQILRAAGHEDAARLLEAVDAHRQTEERGATPAEEPEPQGPRTWAEQQEADAQTMRRAVQGLLDKRAEGQAILDTDGAKGGQR